MGTHGAAIPTTQPGAARIDAAFAADLSGADAAVAAVRAAAECSLPSRHVQTRCLFTWWPSLGRRSKCGVQTRRNRDPSGRLGGHSSLPVRRPAAHAHFARRVSSSGTPTRRTFCRRQCRPFRVPSRLAAEYRNTRGRAPIHHFHCWYQGNTRVCDQDTNAARLMERFGCIRTAYGSVWSILRLLSARTR